MTKTRLEAFSDGVIAIVITIMVLELRPPKGVGLEDLAGLGGKGVSYLLSFVFVGIYWNNHHHLLHAARRVDGGTMWANLHLLFWLSLVPFATAWMGEHGLSRWPVALYGFVLLGCAAAYTVLQGRLIAANREDGRLARAVADDRKGKASLAIYVASILAAFFAPALSCAGFVAVAVIWLVPDRRIERALD